MVGVGFYSVAVARPLPIWRRLGVGDAHGLDVCMNERMLRIVAFCMCVWIVRKMAVAILDNSNT